MKPLLSLFFLLASFSVMAQTTEGVVSYREEIVNPKAAEIRAKMKERGFQVDIPDVNINNKNLYFNGQETIYKEKPKEEKAYEGREVGGSSSVRFSFWGGGNKNGYYRKMGTLDYLQEKDLMGKTFLVEDEEEKYQWKITGRTEQLGQYQVIEAVTVNKEDTIQAWFTPQIPISSGPAEFSQLPGLILRVDINQGKRLIYATNIDVRALTEEELIVKPSKGKKMTNEKFIAMRDEKLEEMKKMYGEERGSRMIGR